MPSRKFSWWQSVEIQRYTIWDFILAGGLSFFNALSFYEARMKADAYSGNKYSGLKHYSGWACMPVLRRFQGIAICLILADISGLQLLWYLQTSVVFSSCRQTEGGQIPTPRGRTSPQPQEVIQKQLERNLWSFLIWSLLLVCTNVYIPTEQPL